MRILGHRFGKRTTVVVGMMVALVIGGAFSAQAYNYCQNEPVPGDIGVDVGPGIVWVGVDTGLNNYPPGAGVCVNNTTLGTNTRLAASPATGIYTGVNLCENTTCSQPGGETGGETRVVSCNATTGGSCTQGTIVKAAGITLVNLAPKTGVDDNITLIPVVTQGTTPAQTIGCVGSTCVRSVKVSAGRLDVYANSNTPIPVHLCASVGPGFTCP